MSVTPPDALIIVYNADEGLGAALFDAVHKLVRPDTYPCDLCAITYGSLSMRGQWRDWLKAQAFAVEFYHRQDFHRQYPAHVATPLPTIFRRDGATVQPLIAADAMHKDMPVSELILMVEKALNSAPIAAPNA